MAIKVSGTEVISDDKRILNNESLPDIRPSLLLDFANSKTLDPRITFTRGSTATYWDGKTTAKAEENLFKYSEQFDNSYWTKARTDVTANATTAPDGTTTAEALNQVSGITQIGRVFNSNLPNPAGDFTASVYAKANTRNFLAISTNDFVDTGFNYTYFNLSTGAVGTTDSGHTASITDVGNGWYRCSLTFTSVSAGSDGDVGFAIPDTDGSQTCTDDQKGIYLWGAQLEQRSSATAYTPTTSSPIVKYQPVLQTAASGEARFDHDPVTGESKGLLIEEARTNLLTYSEAFDNAEFIKTNVIITANSVVAPDGTLTADKLIANTTSAEHYTQDSLVPATGTFTDSIYAKSSDDYLFAIRPVHVGADVGNTFTAYFNLNTGTIRSTWPGTTATIEDVGNGWYRCSISYTVSGTLSGAYACRFQLYKEDELGAVVSSYAGDNSTGVYIWGAQREEQTAPFRLNDAPSSYIPTSGSTVTRAQDHGFISQADAQEVYNPSDFTLYHESINAMRYSEAVGISPGIGSILATFSTSSMGNDLYSSATSVVATNVGTDYVKAAVGVNLNSTEYTMAASGNVKTVTATKLPFETTGIRIGSRGSASTSFPMQGAIKKVVIYPKSLSSAILQAMTEE